MRATLPFTPRVAAAHFRRGFAKGSLELAASLEQHAPAGVAVAANVPYGPDRDEVMDIYRPAGTVQPLPVFIWIHGGGWFGGAKDEAAGYFKLIASHGYAVISPAYTLAPRGRYPMPTRQVMQAIGYLRANADRLRLAGDDIVVGGDSAGGHIASQIGALVTTPGYAEIVGIQPTITAAELRGLVLACGFYDLPLARTGELDPAFAHVLRIELWSHAGRRDFMTDPGFATMSVADHVSEEFPKALVTAGSADPLESQSRRMAERLAAAGAKPETLFFAAGQTPPVPHEYQFQLGTDAAQQFLERMLSFLERRSARVAPAIGE